MKLALVGCGLMGGSFALAAKNAGIVDYVAGFDVSEASLQTALQRGIIDYIAQTTHLAIKDADLILLAAPVVAIQSLASEIIQVAKPNVLIMDLGSTKKNILDALMRDADSSFQQRIESCFVPSHPICGREVSGVEHADTSLYSGCRTVLCPFPSSPPELITRAEQVWRAVGATKIERMTCEQHDDAYAAVSHLPHLIAFAFMESVSTQPDGRGEQHLALAGPGFRDFTRIAASNAPMWRDILIANRSQVLQQLNQFEQHLGEWKQLLIDSADETTPLSEHPCTHSRSINLVEQVASVEYPDSSSSEMSSLSSAAAEQLQQRIAVVSKVRAQWKLNA
jgi:prephenate dehydrogenase